MFEYREHENAVTFAGCVEEPTTNYPLSFPLQGAVTGCVEDALMSQCIFYHPYSVCAVILCILISYPLLNRNKNF